MINRIIIGFFWALIFLSLSFVSLNIATLVMLVLFLLSFLEIYNIFKDNNKNTFLNLYYILLTVVLILIYYFFRNNYNDFIKYFTYLFIFSNFIILFIYNLKNITNRQTFSLFFIIFLVGIFIFTFLQNLNSDNKSYYFLILLTTWFFDSFSYLSGNFFGKTTFTKISPRKTIEGLIGGVLITILTNSLLFFFTDIYKFNLSFIIFLLINILFIFFAFIGDLYFSFIKRIYKIKDYSNILLGHGGILDRIDSLIFVSLVAEVIKIWL